MQQKIQTLSTPWKILAMIVVSIFFFHCKNNSGADVPLTGDPAIDALSAAIAETPDDAELYFQRAELFYEKEAFDQATLDLAALLKIDSTHLRAHHLLADVYLDNYQSARALQTLERAAALYPDSINTRLKLSEFQLILKQYTEATQTIRNILDISPGNPEAYFMLGLIYRDQGKTDLAINAFQTSVELNPDQSEAWIILGDLMDRTQNPLAIQYFDNAIRVDSSNIAAWHAKAYFLQNNEEIDAALDIYTHIHKINYQYPEAYLNAAILHLYRDSIAAAEKEIDILTQIDPTNAAAWFYKGKVYQFRGQLEQAKSAFEQALRLDEDYQQAIDALQEIAD